MNARLKAIRLFPVPFRLIDGKAQFKKWQWITAQVGKARKDHLGKRVRSCDHCRVRFLKNYELRTRPGGIAPTGHAGSFALGAGAANGYVLAEELGRSPDDHIRAFAAYETRMRPYVLKNKALTWRDRSAPEEEGEAMLEEAKNFIAL